jgi:ferredoxin
MARIVSVGRSRHRFDATGWTAKTSAIGHGQGIFNRTVSANLGMSYSISNVFAEAGLDNIMRWVPFHMDERDLRNRVKNKMIRPTTIPQMMEELILGRWEEILSGKLIWLCTLCHTCYEVCPQGVGVSHIIIKLRNLAAEKGLKRKKDTE